MNILGVEIGDNGESLDILDATMISSNFWPSMQVRRITILMVITRTVFN